MGASLLANAVCKPTSAVPDKPYSRAGSLPHLIFLRLFNAPRVPLQTAKVPVPEPCPNGQFNFWR
ncbi:hypothetical protein CXF97_08220 [Pseudomonas sp. Choline-02u-1]|nr:hypothetical protein CXF97_08220 [Pseudomonas sp. Choline-02u-1]